MKEAGQSFHKRLKEASLRVEMVDQTQGTTSDTTADLKPTDLSPLPQEKESRALRMTNASDGQDEKHDEAETWSSRNTAGGTKSGVTLTRTTSPLELHRRCRETIERCTTMMRDRERKMQRLQLALPLSSFDQRPNRHCATPPTRSTPPRLAKRNKLNATSLFNREMNSPDRRSPAWSVSSTRSRPSTRLRSDGMTTSPLINRNSKNQAQMRPPFRVTPDTPKPSSHKKENEGTQESTLTPSSEELSSIDKSPSSSHNISTMLSPTWSRRQQDFMAAIEDEANNDDKLP